MTDRNADAANSHAAEEITLPEELAALLNSLNLAQHQLDDARFKEDAWGERTFADWVRYMQATYPPPGEQEDYPDSDLIRAFIMRQDLQPLRKQREARVRFEREVAHAYTALAGRLTELQRVTAGDVENWSLLAGQIRARREAALKPLRDVLPEGALDSDAQSRLIDALNTLIDTPNLRGLLTLSNQALANLANLDPAVAYRRINRVLLQALLPALARRPGFELHRTAAPRFWQPREPVLLLVGKDVQPTDRYPDVTASLHETDDVDFDDPVTLAGVLALRGRVKQERPDWHPLLLEWEVEVTPLGGEHSNLPQ